MEAVPCKDRRKSRGGILEIKADFSHGKASLPLFHGNGISVEGFVHPAKREVRFHRSLDVREAILESVTNGLRPPAPVLPVKAPSPDIEIVRSELPEKHIVPPTMADRPSPSSASVSWNAEFGIARSRGDFGTLFLEIPENALVSLRNY